MKWDLKERHSKSPRAYQIVSERPQIATQRPSNGVVSPIANNYSTADVACIDQMQAGGKGGGHGPPPPTWPKLKTQQQKRPTTLKLDVGAAQRAPPEPVAGPRPQTATLDRPRILDIALLGKIDMSLTRKALLSISSLCVGAPADAAKRNGASPGDGRGGKARRFAGAARRGRQQQRGANTDDDDGTSSGTAPPTPRRQPPAGQAGKQQQLRAPASRRRPAPAGDVEAGAAGVPQPCTTCGRHEQPERLHSHPPARHQQQQAPQSQPQAPPQPPKSSVRKPMPINFRSSASASSAAQQQQQQTSAAVPDKPSVPLPAAAAPAATPAAPAAAPAAAPEAVTAPAAPRAPGRPRTVVCYLCGREFGTKSYPLHEPHCLQKWHRENSQLPPQLQREPPPRPPQPPASHNWNHLAWEAVQGSLVPCDNCGRTFNPDRLEVHQRSCRVAQPKRAPVQPQQEEAKAPPAEPISAAAAAALARVGHACHWCGRLFGSASLRIHEAQCARRQDRSPPAAAAAAASPAAPASPAASPPAAASAAASPEHRPRGPRMLVCYLCGRGFTQASLHIHEAQCLKRWHQENDRLPPAQRRPTPERPAVVLTGAGGWQ